jgi:Flp pilus assembly protein TadD
MKTIPTWWTRWHIVVIDDGSKLSTAREFSTLVDQGSACAERGDLDEALRFFSRADKLSQDTPIALNNIGMIHGFRGDSDRAATFFRKALTIDPDDAMALANLGGAFRGRKG